jgi:hypothetical protein
MRSSSSNSSVLVESPQLAPAFHETDLLCGLRVVHGNGQLARGQACVSRGQAACTNVNYESMISVVVVVVVVRPRRRPGGRTLARREDRGARRVGARPEARG